MKTLEQIMRAVNIRNTIRMYADALDVYSDFCRAYVTAEKGKGFKYPNLHNNFAANYEVEAMRISGSRWGENPNDPSHPMNIYNRKSKCQKFLGDGKELK